MEAVHEVIFVTDFDITVEQCFDPSSVSEDMTLSILSLDEFENTKDDFGEEVLFILDIEEETEGAKDASLYDQVTFTEEGLTDLSKKQLTQLFSSFGIMR